MLASTYRVLADHWSTASSLIGKAAKIDAGNLRAACVDNEIKIVLLCAAG